MRNLSYENELYMQFLFHANQSHFHNNGFALRLALKQRHRGTRKWPIKIPQGTFTNTGQFLAAANVYKLLEFENEKRGKNS